ncbi:PREDICTED: uncharacterized protein LOC105148151 isoform X1 [Acromyrmex echinatior]|uniref:uncharacterized protein LOC105148151 isoform X1 n=1 Tax=Acromyrmex echinatior TaxID=103372 RepID=UPI000581019E|nr:PREDICTED: uncharacterized protein LOC105148151 isoform X1 [Acromyrmex echinatior]
MNLFTEARGTAFEREGFTLNSCRSLAFGACVTSSVAVCNKPDYTRRASNNPKFDIFQYIAYQKRTDSRFGVGFRLGEHADFQILIELGPQTETDPIGVSNDAKRRRDAMINAAMKGELGPLAQAVAKYQINREIQKEMDELKIIEEKLKKIKTENTKAQDKFKKEETPHMVTYTSMKKLQQHVL